MRSRTLLTLVAILLAGTAHAGVITGRVVNAAGTGVPNVNIAVVGAGGPTIANGGTDALGFFTATITPDGVYDLHFEPPAPPVTTHLVKVLTAVPVTGSVNLGDVALPPGVALTGRAVRASGGTAVPGVNLDVAVNGVDLPLTHDSTDAFGQFSIAVPKGVIEVRFKTDGTALPLLAPHKVEVALSVNTSLGDVPLQPGFVLSAIVRRQSNSTAVVGADLDVSDALTGSKLFTPGDNTDAAGFVDVIVPAGTYDIEIGPRFADRLVATTLLAQAVTANKFLGTILLQGGVVLSGNVRDSSGLAHAQVDVDLRNSATLAAVTLTGDNTNANGDYAVVVPTGTFDVEFTPPNSLPLGAQSIAAVFIGGDRTLNGTLPTCVLVYCTSKPSSVPNCVPHVVPPCSASIAAGPGSTYIRCLPVPGGIAPGLLLYTTAGAAASPIQGPYGTLCLQTGPGFHRVAPAQAPGGAKTTCTGSYVFDFGAFLSTTTDPNLLPGAQVDVQVWYRDVQNPGGANLSDAARFVLTP